MQLIKVFDEWINADKIVRIIEGVDTRTKKKGARILFNEMVVPLVRSQSSNSTSAHHYYFDVWIFEKSADDVAAEINNQLSWKK